MSFLKISDPLKRDAIVKEYLELKKKIRDNFLSERIGESELQTNLSKFYRPITETQKTTTREITERHFLTKPDTDKTFGVRKEKGHHYIGNQHVVIEDDNIIISKYNERFEGTQGLWELITSKNPKNFTDKDYDNYKDLMIMTNALHHGNNENNPHPKSSGGAKWKLLSPIWYRKKGGLYTFPKKKEGYEGEGVVVIPSDPNALLERLDLLLASQEAGHTGVRNELVSICDELKRQGVLDTKTYKKLNSNIKK